MNKFSFMDRFRIPTYDNPKHMNWGALDFDPEKCKQCGICVSLCPGGSILTDSLKKSDFLAGRPKSANTGVPRLDSLKPGVELCMACFDCGTACPYDAISVKHQFNPGYFFKRLTQTSDLRYPKKY